MADERDPKVSQRYRELGAEEPSRELDQAILAAAHRAADKPHAPLVTPAGRHRWYFSLGAAAVIVLAVAVTWHVEREQPDPVTALLKEEAPLKAPAAEEKPLAADRFKEAKPAGPPPAASAPKAAAPSTPKIQPPREFARDAAPAASAPAESRIRENVAGDVARAETQKAPVPVPPAPGERRDEVAAAEAKPPSAESRPQQPDAARQSAGVGGLELGTQGSPAAAPESPPAPQGGARVRGGISAGAPSPTPQASPAPQAATRPDAGFAREPSPAARSAPAPQAAPAPQPGAAVRGPPVSAYAYIDSPERFLERIAELRKEGKHNEADRLLAEFRQRYPDYRISKETLEKVERKK